MRERGREQRAVVDRLASASVSVSSFSPPKRACVYTRTDARPSQPRNPERPPARLSRSQGYTITTTLVWHSRRDTRRYNTSKRQMPLPPGLDDPVLRSASDHASDSPLQIRPLRLPGQRHIADIVDVQFPIAAAHRGTSSVLAIPL